MKKILLFSISVLLLAPSSMAGHIIGGTIYWECVNNGKYQFFMEVYRDCSGIPYVFRNKEITIVGSPLPKDSNGIVFNKIVLRPDSAKWISINYGDISPTCDDELVVGSISCENEDRGATQQFNFISDTIELNGTPPSNGWRLSYETSCCRPSSIVNAPSNGGFLLRAIMYSNKGNDPFDTCYNSSPKFSEKIDYYSCNNQMKYANNQALDVESDSIGYSFDQSYIGLNVPVAVTYNPGYDFDNPTPDQNFDSLNVPASLNKNNGLLTYKANYNSTWGGFLVVIRADEFRDNTRVSSIFREYIIKFYDCLEGDVFPELSVYEGFNGSNNFNEVEGPDYTIRVDAGEKVRLSLRALIKDSSGVKVGADANFNLSSSQFSASISDSSLCDTPPCAEISRNAGITFDSVAQKYVGSTDGSFYGYLDWQTDCQHLDTNGLNKIYQFNLKSITQICDTVEVRSEVINIEIVNEIEEKPKLYCLYTPSKDEFGLSWDTSGVNKNRFQYWSIYGSRPNGSFEMVDTINNYYSGSNGINNANFSKLDSGVFPNAFIRSNSLKCSAAAPGISSDTLSKFATLTHVNDELVVQLSPPVADYTFLWANCNPITKERDTLLAVKGARYTPPVSGYYSAISGAASNGYPCVDVTNCIYYVKPVGLGEIAFQEQVTLYPNPTNGMVHIKLKESAREVSVQVRNIQGQLIKEERFNKQSFQLDLPASAGIYFIQLTNSKGEIANLKVVKQ